MVRNKLVILWLSFLLFLSTAISYDGRCSSDSEHDSLVAINKSFLPVADELQKWSAAEYLKTSLYGENSLKIKGGKADIPKYRLFGENRIDTQALKSYSATANSYGESRIKLNTQDQLRVNAFGECSNHLSGGCQY